MLLVSKLKNNQEFTQLIVKEESIQGIDDEIKIDQNCYCYLNTMFIQKSLLQDLLPKIIPHQETQEYELSFIIRVQPQSFKFYTLNPYIANKESILIKNSEDKDFAEEIYMENRNAIFIHQCYGLWKRCELFENRLAFVEEILEKHDLN